MMNLVSVIVLTYNSENTIIETLESIKNQTYKNIELIIADDNSTDATIKLINEWLVVNEGRFVNISIINSNINEGVTKNCNKGVSVANGEYVQLIAGDDILLTDAIEYKVKYANKHSNEIIITKVEVFGNQDLVNEMTRFCERGYDILGRTKEEQYKALLEDNYIAGPSWGFLKRAIYDEIGYYDERFPMMEDYPFLIKLMRNGYTFTLLNKITARYRMHYGSLCQSRGPTRFKDSMDLFLHYEKGVLLLKNRMYKVYFCQMLRSLYYRIYVRNFRKNY